MLYTHTGIWEWIWWEVWGEWGWLDQREGRVCPFHSKEGRNTDLFVSGFKVDIVKEARGSKYSSKYNGVKEIIKKEELNK